MHSDDDVTWAMVESVSGRAVPPGPPNPARARELIAELLNAFGLQQARRGMPATLNARQASRAQRKPRHVQPLIVAGVAVQSNVLRQKNRHTREHDAAGAVAARVLPRVRSLRVGSLLPPNVYSSIWRGVIAEWNGAISANGWTTVAPLCEGCGLPVLRRGTRRGVTFACSLKCKGRHNARVANAKKRAVREQKKTADKIRKRRRKAAKSRGASTT